VLASKMGFTLWSKGKFEKSEIDFVNQCKVEAMYMYMSEYLHVTLTAPERTKPYEFFYGLTLPTGP